MSWRCAREIFRAMPKTLSRHRRRLRRAKKNYTLPQKTSNNMYRAWGRGVRNASLAQLVGHALRKRMVVGSIPTGGFPATTPITRPFNRPANAATIQNNAALSRGQ